MTDTKEIKFSVYYHYEGDSLIITRDPQIIMGEVYENIQIETYNDRGQGMFITMTYDNWLELVRKVGELKIND